jgi:hypothetical protein
MAFFKPNISKQLATAISQRDALVARLSDAEVAIIERQTAAEQAALDGASDDVLAAAEGKLRAAQDRRMTLRAALTKAEAAVTDLEHARDEAADRALRERTGAQVELLARELVDTVASMVEAADRLSACTYRANTVVPEAASLNHFAQLAKGEIPAAGEMIARLLRQHAAAVLAGHAPAAMPLPPEAYIEPAAPAASPTQTLFCLRSVKWTDDAGQQRIAGPFQDAELPVPLVPRALKSGACVPLTDPRRRELYGAQPGHPRAATALDLDAEPEPPVRSPTEPIQHSAFEQPRIGEPYTLRIAR